MTMRAIAALAASLALGPALADAPSGQNVILVTLDGVRVQEIFGGMDPMIANAPEEQSGIYEAEVVRKRWWRDTPEERREVLMPFLWKTLAPAGMVLGNQAKGSKVTVRNDQWFSNPTSRATTSCATRTGRCSSTPARHCRSSRPGSRKSGPGTGSSTPHPARTAPSS
jgi:hypothetical protein